MKYKTKPVIKEAIQFTGIKSVHRMDDEWGKLFSDVAEFDAISGRFQIRTLEGPHNVSLGDYVIKGLHGEFYPCKPDIFEKTYEPIIEES